MRTSPSWIAAFALGISSAASCASDTKPQAAPQPEPATIAAPMPVATAPSPEEDEDAVTGKSLYQRFCAGCHNDNGDGRGATMLQQGKQARSFAQGGFAFGNTVEQIAKTIASGIPGSSPMQGFKSQMDEDERKLVAEYVLTLTPYKAEVKSKDSVMVVGDRAVIARGKLPALHEGGPEHPRGLMIGLPGGLSFEYSVDDVRLLAVRRGAFVDRTDWNERGGGVLQPLGEIVDDPCGGGTSPWLYGWRLYPPMRLDPDGHWGEGAWGELQPGPFPLRVALDSTAIEPGGTARLRYTLSPDLSRALQRIERATETLSKVELDGARGYRRHLTFGSVHMLGSDPNVEAVLASWPAGTEFVHGGPGPRTANAATSTGFEDAQVDKLKDPWVVTRVADGFELRCFALSAQPHWREMEGRECVMAYATAWDMEVVALHAPEWDAARLERWARELETR